MKAEKQQPILFPVWQLDQAHKTEGKLKVSRHRLHQTEMVDFLVR